MESVLFWVAVIAVGSIVSWCGMYYFATKHNRAVLKRLVQELEDGLVKEEENESSQEGSNVEERRGR